MFSTRRGDPGGLLGGDRGELGGLTGGRSFSDGRVTAGLRKLSRGGTCRLRNSILY